MTLDEAIKHAEEVAEEKEKLANVYESFKDYGYPKSSITSGHEKCLICAKEHRQLAEWLKDYKRLLEKEPKTGKESDWIPISERLPEDKTYVLTTIKIPNRIAHARSGWYESGFFHNDNGDVWKATDMEVIAWMPLPEPYKVESEVQDAK